MKEQKTTTFQEALAKRQVKENDYFLINYPDGRKKLFRLVKTKKGYFMWGPPTDKKVLFIGEDGYDNLFILADAQVKKEYSLPDVFEEVHACGLLQREYEVHSSQEMRKILKDARIMYEHPDDAKMIYILASRCVWHGSTNAYFSMFIMYNAYVYDCSLHNLNGGIGSSTLAVRPEAVPNPTMKLLIEGCDGSKQKPWICV